MYICVCIYTYTVYVGIKTFYFQNYSTKYFFKIKTLVSPHSTADPVLLHLLIRYECRLWLFMG